MNDSPRRSLCQASRRATQVSRAVAAPGNNGCGTSQQVTTQKSRCALRILRAVGGLSHMVARVVQKADDAFPVFLPAIY